MTQLQTQYQAQILSFIDTSSSQNNQTIWGLTHWRAIKEESKVAKRDWVDHQACSLL